VRELEVAGVPVRAVRVSYAGELGWELYVRLALAPHLYDALTARGDVVDGGYYALDSLRMEKGYRAWGRELTPDDTPLEAGMAFTVSFDKPGGFVGREALLAQRARGLARRLVLFALDDPEAMAWGEEPIYRDGELVGVLTSAAYGHGMGRSLGMGYVRLGGGEAHLPEGRYEIDLAGTRVPATPSLRGWHDPTGARMKV
jgi:4-methylaminobutanoate oxidase (formaldehyde-forming)